ncbi:hypothetical protein O181_120394, partial [Austropuccinia psidii MF-1]|nr:hypothetical protein [Austropuccinia psidii MF-1]
IVSRTNGYCITKSDLFTICSNIKGVFDTLNQFQATISSPQQRQISQRQVHHPHVSTLQQSQPSRPHHHQSHKLPSHSQSHPHHHHHQQQQ